VAVSTIRLGTPPDIVLLHNPEFFFTEQLYRTEQVTKEEADIEFEARVTGAFAALEELTFNGAIGSGYGVSSNIEGCWWSVSGLPNKYEAVCLEMLIRAAEGVGGEKHNMRSLQIPLNLLELGGAMGFERDGYDGMHPSSLRQAKAEGIGVMLNRPLKAIPPPYLHSETKGHMNLSESTEGTEQPTSSLKNALKEALIASPSPVPHPQASLAQLALWLATSTHGVDVTLCSASQTHHLEELMAVLEWPPAQETDVWELFDRAQDAVAIHKEAWLKHK